MPDPKHLTTKYGLEYIQRVYSKGKDPWTSKAELRSREKLEKYILESLVLCMNLKRDCGLIETEPPYSSLEI